MVVTHSICMHTYCGPVMVVSHHLYTLWVEHELIRRTQTFIGVGVVQ